MKSAFIRLLRALNVERVAVFHATSEPEAADIRRIFSRSRVFVVPNGVWCPSDIDVQSARRNRKIGEDYVLFLGRLDPYKQIEKIIEAFSKVVRGNHDGDQPGKLRLCVAGVGDESYLSILRRTAEEMKLAGEIDFLGHIEGKDKVAVLANASVLVLASKTENFGMSVAEALAWGVPVVASWGTPWQELDNRGCGRWVEDSADNLADAIRSIIALSAAERGQMGLRGRAWMADEYRWDCLARKTINLR
jgi:glycosyltransferase involved in cell wall biosynthesis